MIGVPLALGAGQWIGGWGLRQVLDVLQVPTPFYTESNLPGVFFYSPSGELIAGLTAGRGAGEKLNIRWREDKLGGLQDFEIALKKTERIPFFSGMLARFFIGPRAWGVGEVRSWPPTDTKEQVIKITGIGLALKLQDIKYTGTFSDMSAREILEALIPEIQSAGIVYNTVKAAAPELIIDRLDFNNKTVYDVIDRLIRILNYNYNEIQFVWGVDASQEFYFYSLPAIPRAATLFEGFDFQDPECEMSAEDLFNKVKIFRATSGGGEETELVGEFSDPDSIDEFGEIEKKLVISDFIGADVAEKIAAAMLEEYKRPKKRISVKDLVPSRPLPWGFYGIVNKKELQYYQLADFSKLTEWSAALSSSSISINTSRAFTGRQCFAWEIDNSVGDKITLTIDRKYGPRMARIFTRHPLAAVDLKITFFGATSRRIRTLGLSSGDHMGESGGSILSVIDAGEGYVSAYLERRVPNDWLKTDIDLTSMLYIDSVEIEVMNPAADTVLLDTLTLEAFSGFFNTLTLETADYAVSDFSVKATAEFGNRRHTLITGLEKLDEKNNVTYDLFSKE